jgi:16S rRNA (adenine1518-N6/adenine1519-N6)-dimethyltransferase
VLGAIAPHPTETFVEVGPGLGALTRPLAERASAVVAFEIDRDLAFELRKAALPNLTIVEGDFLKSHWLLDGRLEGPVRVAGNLPYNVASPILFKLGEIRDAGVQLVDATLMLQREVADRLAAKPGTREYGVLTILIGHSADIEWLFAIPPGGFRPMPKVHSALVRLRFHAPSPRVTDPATFAGLVRAIFTRRRKTLANALLAFRDTSGLGPGEALRAAGLDGTRRPETLTISELARLADVFVSMDAPRRLPESP